MRTGLGALRWPPSRTPPCLPPLGTAWSLSCSAATICGVWGQGRGCWCTGLSGRWPTFSPSCPVGSSIPVWTPPPPPTRSPPLLLTQILGIAVIEWPSELTCAYILNVNPHQQLRCPSPWHIGVPAQPSASHMPLARLMHLGGIRILSGYKFACA